MMCDFSPLEDPPPPIDDSVDLFAPASPSPVSDPIEEALVEMLDVFHDTLEA